MHHRIHDSIHASMGDKIYGQAQHSVMDPQYKEANASMSTSARTKHNSRREWRKVKRENSSRNPLQQQAYSERQQYNRVKQILNMFSIPQPYSTHDQRSTSFEFPKLTPKVYLAWHTHTRLAHRTNHGRSFKKDSSPRNDLSKASRCIRARIHVHFNHVQIPFWVISVSASNHSPF